MVVRAHNQAKDKKFKSWIWAFGSLLAVLAISFTSCTFFDQSQTYFYAMLGIVASMVLGQPALEKSQQRLRLARVARPVARPRDPVVV
jgi:L-asparagine transporter-like permease